MEDETRGMRLMLAAVLTAIVVGGTVDLVLDAPTRWLSVHVVFELGREVLEVAVEPVRAAGDGDIAPAVKAAPGTERHVDIK